MNNNNISNSSCKKFHLKIVLSIISYIGDKCENKQYLQKNNNDSSKDYACS